MEEQTWEEMAAIVDKRKQLGKERYAEESKKRLAKIAETKIRTTFIGSLSAMEAKLGFLWGYKPELMTAEQAMMLEALEKAGFGPDYFAKLWEETRLAILNNGNNQRRALAQEIEQYSLTWNRYRMLMPVKNPGGI